MNFMPRSSYSKSNPIKVLIVDDHPVFRMAIGHILSHYSDIEVVGEAANGNDALQKVKTLKPTVVILDINLPDMSGLEVLNQLSQMRTKLASSPNVLVLSAHDDCYHITGMINAGAKGYLIKTEESEKIVNGVRKVARGLRVMSEEALNNWIPSASSEKSLTARELEVLKLMAQGYNNLPIAEKLLVGVGTVSNYISKIYRKLEVRTRAQAVVWAWQNGIIAQA